MALKKKASELEFISKINRDGKSVTEIDKEEAEALLEHEIQFNEEFELHCLSLTEKTYVAFNFNVYIVKLKIQNNG